MKAMPVAIDNFAIDEVIVHDVAKNDGATPVENGVTLTDAPMPDLDVTRRNFFTERISRSLGGRAFSVVRDPNQPSKVPEHVARILGDPSQLVAASQDIARQLYAVQNKVNNAGLLTVISGIANAERCVSVLKLERQAAVRMKLIDTPEGGRAFSAAILDDLTLADDTRVFKASIFRADQPEANALEGKVSDEQRGYDPRTAVAEFFLSRFLGCCLAKEPEVETKAFYESSREFFNSIEDDERRREYSVAVAATLRSPATTIRPGEFAETFLRTEDRQAYLEHLSQQDVQDEAFDKDTHLIDARLRKPMLRTSSGIVISGPAEAMGERVRQVQDENGPAIVIRDRLDELPS